MAILRNQLQDKPLKAEMWNWEDSMYDWGEKKEKEKNTPTLME